jgi:hypothetical protein
MNAKLFGIAGVIVAVGSLPACSLKSDPDIVGKNEGATDASSSLVLDTPDAIDAYLAGTTWVETGTDIPEDPTGHDENLPTSNECWNTVTVQFPSSTAAGATTWVVGTFDTSEDGAVTCNHAAISGSFTSESSGPLMIADVQGNGTCFDLAGLGRASISPDGKILSLEVYNAADSPSGDTCAAGAVGSKTVTLNGVPVTGDAVQILRLQ